MANTDPAGNQLKHLRRYRKQLLRETAQMEDLIRQAQQRIGAEQRAIDKRMQENRTSYKVMEEMQRLIADKHEDMLKLRGQYNDLTADLGDVVITPIDEEEE